MIEVSVVGIRLEEGLNSPILILQELDTPLRVLELWIGAVEAGAIAFAQQGLSAPRPLTHELLLKTIQSLGSSLESVVITDLREGTFYAELRLSSGVSVSARPSDAVAVAVHAECPIFVEADVFDVAGKPSGAEVTEVAEDDQIEEFREFLENLNPEDFA